MLDQGKHRYSLLNLGLQIRAHGALEGHALGSKRSRRRKRKKKKEGRNTQDENERENAE